MDSNPIHSPIHSPFVWRSEVAEAAQAAGAAAQAQAPGLQGGTAQVLGGAVSPKVDDVVMWQRDGLQTMGKHGDLVMFFFFNGIWTVFFFPSRSQMMGC